MSGDLLTTSRMARRLGVASAWLQAEAEAGRVPAVQAGKTYLFAADAVEQALLERAREQRATPADARDRERGGVAHA